MAGNGRLVVATAAQTMTDPKMGEEHGALEALFREQSERVYRVAYRVTGSPSDAEDVLQTIFLRLLKRADFPDLSRSAGSYLHRAAVNAGLDLLRARKRSFSVPIEDQDEEGYTVVETDPNRGAEVRAEGAELRERLREAMTRLSPKAAEIFALRYFEGYGNTEIAELLDTTRSAVGVTLHRTREKLKEELAPYEI